MSDAVAHATSPSDANRFAFLPFKSFIPFEWCTLGTAFANDGGSKLSAIDTRLAGRSTFVVRQGFDPVDDAATGRILEGDTDMGVALRAKTLAFALTASNLTMRAGLDNPLDAGVASARTAPSLKATVAKRLGSDSDAYVAASYDLKQRKPEFGVCLAGDAGSDKATLCLSADPTNRALKIGAAVSFPGSEWRDTVFNEAEDVLEEPADDGGRHRLWVRHEARRGDLLHRTALGGVFDLGRIVNFAADFVDYRVEPRLPPLFWAIPLSQKLYNALVPPEDENQVRHNLKGWDLDVQHEFGRRGPRVALMKSFKYASLSGSWDVHDREAGVDYAMRSGFRLGARLQHVSGSGWGQPSLVLKMEPLSML